MKHALVTSLAAWVAVDSRLPSSFYLASDSRISFDGRPPFDAARKLFASSQYPDLFAYCGAVDFPFPVLEQALKQIDSGRLFSRDDGATARNQKFEALLKSLTYPLKKGGFTVLHAARDGEGMNVTFFLWSIEWAAEKGWFNEPLDLPIESALVLSAGSGGTVIREHNRKWRELLPRTSRSVFSAFCDALESEFAGRTSD